MKRKILKPFWTKMLVAITLISFIGCASANIIAIITFAISSRLIMKYTNICDD